jgi:Na+/H+ antiporter NhaD/arsenite permease-like protein
LVDFLKKEWFFSISFLLFLFLYFYEKPTFSELNNSIDWPTIRALFGLLIITTAIKESNFFDYFALKTIQKINNEKNLSIILILFSLFFSMFLTNDITLFIIVPLTLSFSKIIKSDLTKLIIFEAIAVNVGSSLTPFGNPQNLYIFRQMDISIIDFIKMMSLIFSVMFILLIIFTLLSFKNKKINLFLDEKINVKKPLFYISALLFALFFVALELSLVRYALIVIFFFYLFTYKNILTKIDYILLLTFILMFIDFYMIAKLSFIKSFFSSVNFNFINTFNYTIILSQLISNVPATIFISHFSQNYTAIAYGANLAGNGIIISSLANFIALRFINSKDAYIDFHKYSIPFFFLSYLLVFLIICYFI